MCTFATAWCRDFCVLLWASSSRSSFTDFSLPMFGPVNLYVDEDFPSCMTNWGTFQTLSSGPPIVFTLMYLPFERPALVCLLLDLSDSVVTTSWFGDQLDHPQRPSIWQHNKVRQYSTTLEEQFRGGGGVCVTMVTMSSKEMRKRKGVIWMTDPLLTKTLGKRQLLLYQNFIYQTKEKNEITLK